MKHTLAKSLFTAALLLAATQSGAAPTLPLPGFDCIAMHFGPLQPVVSAVCKLGS